MLVIILFLILDKYSFGIFLIDVFLFLVYEFFFSFYF